MQALRRVFAVFMFLSVILLTAQAARPQAGLKTINNPQGGLIIFGRVEGQSTESGAMGAVLQSVHTQCGEKPQVSKLFQVRGTESVAAFFTDTNHPKGNTPVAGMIIVTKVTTDRVEAALITDNAARFSSTLQPMLKTLFASWHPFEGASAAGKANSGAAAALPPMHKFVAQDRSVSVDLPDDWKADPQSGGGTLAASGPNGELTTLGFAVLANDTRNPRVQQTMRTLQAGGLRGTAYASAFYYPYGTDLAKMFVDTIQFSRHKSNLQSATFEISGESPLPPAPTQHCAHINGHLDLQDGKGKREFNTIFCANAPQQFGLYMTTSYSTSVPVAFADKERTTLGAILASFQVDMAVVQREANAISAPTIAAIHEIGKRAAMQAQAAEERNEIHNSSVYQRWDAADKRNQEFSNYLLDQTVVSDIGNNAHGTLWNQDADWLVHNHPDKFEYVAAPNFWKGIDY